MEKNFDPQAIEKPLYESWEKSGHFKPQGEGTPYCIMLPPPNVTGHLHMGHGFQHTLMDVLIRAHRMMGDETLWQPGVDHAGIATQMVVERQLAEQKISRHDLGREKFTEKVWEWKEKSGSMITEQMRRLGVSVDWSRERFTMDPEFAKAVTEVFTRLYDEKLIYRGKRLVNWDPVLQTAVSDLEVISTEEEGSLWFIRYPLKKNPNEFVVIATTRPETLPGDMAIAVHPEDERYRDWIGEWVQHPLCDRFIPIIGDDSIDPNFGTGCVKITPAHDFNDAQIGQRHHLHALNIFTRDAKLNEEVPEAYRGLDRMAAREKIIADLQTKNYLEKTQAHRLMVPRGDRSHAIIEPYLTDQWYVKVQTLAKHALQVVEDGEIRFYPDNWKKLYYQWMENIEDWCISRQLWWGHRIPAWYDANGHIYVAENKEAIYSKYKLDPTTELTQDNDVLDTWFSAGLWPFVTLGWPNKTEAFEKFYPTQVLVTGFDIIFFWVARMVMMGLHLTEKIPFKDVLITGLIRDAHGQKMSKSKGNVLDPIDLIDGIDLESLVKKRTQHLMQAHLAKTIEKNTQKEFPEGIPPLGTDALRFAFCAIATPGRDLSFDWNRVQGYRNFCNKIWNASRYVLMNTEHHSITQSAEKVEFGNAECWIIAKLQHTIMEVRTHLDNYRFDLMAQSLYEFIWNEYCDWYLELSKPVLLSDEASPAAKQGTRHTLIHVLETFLRLIHPIMPFISEHIWKSMGTLIHKKNRSIMLEPYPEADEHLMDKRVLAEMEWVKQMITSIRNVRGEMNISPAKTIPIFLYKGTQEDQRYVENNKSYLMALAKIESIAYTDIEIPQSAMTLVGDLHIYIPLEGLVDLSVEKTRLQKEIEKTEKEIQRIEAKLSNASFVENAPASVVEESKQKIEKYRVALRKLTEQKESLG